MWWCTPVVPATWEAEVGRSFEPGKSRLQCAKIVPLYSSLDNRERLCLKKNLMKIRNKSQVSGMKLVYHHRSCSHYKGNLQTASLEEIQKLRKLNQFLENCKLPKLSQDVIDNLNSPITIIEIKFVIYNLIKNILPNI